MKEPKPKKSPIPFIADKELAEFRDKFLIPKATFGEKAKGGFIEKFIINQETYPVNKVARYIKGMDYDNFLMTPFWRAISLYVKRRDNRTCCKCGVTSGRMEAHHTTYANHGYELQHLDDLVCMCRKCHTAYHFQHARFLEEINEEAGIL